VADAYEQFQWLKARKRSTGHAEMTQEDLDAWLELVGPAKPHTGPTEPIQDVWRDL